MRREIADAQAHGVGSGQEGWRVRKDGSRFRAVGELSPIRDCKITGFVKILRDIQRQAEETILEERRALEVEVTADIEGPLAAVLAIGDPMRDLGWICTNSWRFGRTDLPVGGFGTYADLFRGYERGSGRTVDPDHVRFWEIFGSFWWACSSLTMAEHYRSGPDRTVERPAIGRRSSECQVDCVNLLIPGPVHLLKAGPPTSGIDMPRTDELITSVRDYLRDDVMKATRGRTQFLARVAGNSLDIVLRDLAVGERHRTRQVERLRTLLHDESDLETLRRLLVEWLRSNGIALDHPGLADYLREAVVNQIAIDQPTYSGLKTALANQAG